MIGMSVLGLAMLANLSSPIATPVPSQQQSRRVTSLTGNIEKVDGFTSKVLGNTRNLIVYLPPGYADSKQKYPVLYVHDGQNIFDGATSYIPNQEWRMDEAAEALIKAKIIEPIIIVGISNAGSERSNEYLPTNFAMGNQRIGGKADRYGQMIREEIMPLIESSYRVKTGPENTGLLGSSFGGVVSCYLGLKHPQVFGKLGLVSPSVWVDDRILLRLILPVDRKIKRPKIWIDMGTSESPDAVRDATDLYNTYVKQGWKSRSEVTLLIDGGAEHNELAWSRRIMSILTYLFPAK